MRNFALILGTIALLLPAQVMAQPQDQQPPAPTQAEQPAQPQGEKQPDLIAVMWRVRTLLVAHRLGLTAEQLTSLVALGEQQAAQWDALYAADEEAENAFGAAIVDAVNGILAGEPPSPDFQQALADHLQADQAAKADAWLGILRGRVAALQLLTEAQQTALGVTDEDLAPPESRLFSVPVTPNRLYQLALDLLHVRDLPPPAYEERRVELAQQIAAGLVPPDSPGFAPFVDAMVSVLDWVYDQPPEMFAPEAGGQWVEGIRKALNLKVAEAGAAAGQAEGRTLKQEFYDVLEMPDGYQAWRELAQKMGATPEQPGATGGEGGGSSGIQ